MMVKKETKTRSASKSATWRIMGVLILATVTYAYTRKWIQTGVITFLHHGIFLIVFYYHERLWMKVERFLDLRLRSLLKMFTYETLCGNIILGSITYCVTGSWKQMTAITLTYIGIKHVAYIFNEYIWDKIKIGKKILILATVLILCSQSSADYWNVSAVSFRNLGMDVELRMDKDLYYKHIHFDWNLKLSPKFTLTFSERESHIKKAGWKVEHKPMLNLTYENGIFNNRSRVTLRIREDQDIWRFRNKITVTPAFFFIAYEAFLERGHWIRNRYYLGANLSSNISIFVLKQDTGAETVWIIGSKLIGRMK